MVKSQKRWDRAAEAQPQKDFTTEATVVTENRRRQKLWVNQLSNGYFYQRREKYSSP